ncbi:MAG: GcrA cell cycle regulator [Aestuariivita sp.]|nr:GcrA cell cycle regulator [Aestuariivita sp.]
MAWTEKRIKTLTELWQKGQTANQIATKLGGVSRNAVIGKVHRLGLTNRTTKSSGKPETKFPTKARTRPGEKSEPQTAKKTASKANSTTQDRPDVKTKAKHDVTIEPKTEPARPPSSAPSAPYGLNTRRQIIPAGQPLPPQPSANEVSLEALAKVQEVEKTAKKIGLLELTERTCKWPIGDPATDNFWFCGLPSLPGKPYCEAHISVAFQPMTSRRERRRS